MKRKSRLFAVPGAVAVILLLAGNVFAWSFALTGDSHDDRSGIFARVLASVERSDMEFLVHGGDMTERNKAAEWDRFRNATASFGKPLYPVIGNRDKIGKGGEKRFARRFGLPGTSYSFDRRDAHFAILDNAGGSLPDKTLSWLDDDLAAHPKGGDGIAFLIVAMHIPPATEEIRPHGTRAGYGAQSAKLLRILKKHGVDAVLCGHEHMNITENWEGILVVVSGIERIPFLPFQRSGFYRIDLEDGAVRAKFVGIDAAP
ncbi:MAG: metallophosphoesterase [Deltaproteobacteria bacterium]|nr:metallophosphoesterase [Deltaproteobacteria bacterium]